MTSTLTSDELQERCARIELVLLDVDGVLTNGQIYVGTGGLELTAFCVRDGLAMKLALLGGLPVGVISGRDPESTRGRAEQLGLPEIHLGHHAKLPVVQEILERRSLSLDTVAYMGDDVIDLPVLRRVGLAAAPADACSEVLATCHWTSTQQGGAGCVRELLETILRAKGLWAGLVDRVCS